MRNLIITTGSLIFLFTIFFLQFHFNEIMITQIRKEFAREEAENAAMVIFREDESLSKKAEQIAQEIYDKNLKRGKEKKYDK